MDFDELPKVRNGFRMFDADTLGVRSRKPAELVEICSAFESCVDAR